MKSLRNILRFILRVKVYIVTYFYCILARLPFDTSWNINSRIFVVRPNLFHPKPKLTIGEKFKCNGKLTDNTFGIIQAVYIRLLPSAEVIIGNNVGISGSTISASKKIIIGNNVLIGSGCVITDSDSHPIIPEYRNDTSKIKSAPVVIEDDVFIGARTIVLKGVTIGCGSVVGAGSVVTKNIPPRSVVAGNPAVFIKNI